MALLKQYENRKSILLSKNYVYYESLKNNKNPHAQKLYDNAVNSLMHLNSFNNRHKNADLLYKMAEQEYKKEIFFLEKTFGVKLNPDLYSKNAAKNIIEAFNDVINLKTAYERNIKRILKNQEDDSVGQTNIASFLDGYISKAINDNLKSLYFSIFNAMKSNKFNSSVLETKITEMLNKSLDEAIYNALNSNTFKGEEDDNKAYQELLSAMDKLQGERNAFKKELYKLYKLNEVSDYLKKELHNKINPTKNNKADIKKIVAKNHYSNGGISTELLENFIANSLIKIRSDNFSISTKKNGVIHSGNLGTKADNIYVYGLPLEEIEQFVKSYSGSGHRDQNINFIKNLGQQLKNFNEGTIIYSSAKNYTINKDFKSHGFTGDNSSLRVFLDLLKDSPFKSHAYNLVGAITNTLEGAIAQNRTKEYENAIARYIAYFLFDDINILGTNSNKGPNVLHIFNLNGILIPLSFLLKILGDAYNSVTKKPESYVKISISKESIKYPEETFEGEYTQEHWDIQRDEALDQIKISVHFLQNFADILKTFL